MSHELFRFASVDTPSPGLEWRRLSDIERHTRVTDVCTRFTDVLCARSALLDGVVIVAAKEDGQIIVNFSRPISAAERGTLLLDFEVFLKKTIDPGLVVWMAPIGDLNTLRHFRGVEVKS